MTYEQKARYEHILDGKVNALIGGFASGFLADGGSMQSALNDLERNQDKIIRLARIFADEGVMHEVDHAGA